VVVSRPHDEGTSAGPVVRADPAQFRDVEFAQRFAGHHLEAPFDDLDDGVRVALVDQPAVGPARGTFLLLHGEPSWGALYERWIPELTAAGFRCVAPDLIGFGRSDKVTVDEWYSYERHVATIRHVITTLDLVDVWLVVQDWAGPIGLRQLVDDPGRFRRAFVFNTWLHRPGYTYSDGLRQWHEVATDPDRLGGDMPTGRIVASTMSRPDHDLAAVRRTYDAPFTRGAPSKAGARAFPAMLPFADPGRGGADAQQRCFEALTTAPPCPVHVAFADADPIFPFDHGAELAARIPGATLDRIVGAGHFVQADAPADCLEVIRRRAGDGR
jgi:haloalkane dehalogenase